MAASIGGILGAINYSDLGGAVSDLFGAQGNRYKAAGDRAEQANYLRAAGLADENERFTELSTRIKQAQTDREIYKSLGETRADVAGAGFAESGSALDILRESASQGALTKAVLAEQGLITEAGYREQAQSYRTMADAAGMAAKAEDVAARGAEWTAGLKAVGALFGAARTIATGGIDVSAVWNPIAGAAGGGGQG
jgi:hypothetical protein